MRGATRLASATAKDAPALARILGDWIRETPWMPKLHSREEDLGYLQHLIARTEVTVLHGDGPAGFIAVDGDDVPALYLAPAARGQGGGRALLDHARYGRDRLEFWTFRANTGARRFYDREGFREIARTEGDNEAGLPDLRLLWQRAAS